jgi:hypothetical protein
MKTAITEMFGIEHPIIQGGMHYVGFAELASFANLTTQVLPEGAFQSLRIEGTIEGDSFRSNSRSWSSRL